MNLSKYQNNFINHVLSGTGHGISEAVAGSGKSTTIEQAVRAASEMQNSFDEKSKILIAAFNKHIEVAMTQRGFGPNVTVKTLNGFGHGIVTKAFGRVQLDKFKTSNILKEICDSKKFWTLKGPCTRIVSLLKANLIFEPTNDDLAALRDEHDLAVADGDFEIIIRVLNEGLKTKNYIDFDDQLLYPVYYDLPIPQFDFLFADEYQDFNLGQLELTSRAVKSGRFLAVGDSRQSIYAFRGANPKAMSEFRKRFQPTDLPLSICYRCAKRIVEEARKYCPEIESFESQIDGLVESVSMEAFSTKVKPSDYVLCRTTAPLVSSCLKMIREGKRATVKGRDIGQGLINLAEKIKNTSGLSPSDAINEYRLCEIEKLSRNDNNEDKILKVNDDADTLQAILESVTIKKTEENSPLNVGWFDIIRKLEEIFSDETSDSEILFCTIHRSKGLEAKRVFILPTKGVKAKSDIQIQQERNLNYVAITRAKEELYYVTAR